MARYFILAAALLLSACSSTQKKPIADDPFYAPVYPEAPRQKLPQRALFIRIVKRRVCILIFEPTKWVTLSPSS